MSDPLDDPYETGYCVAALEIKNGTASYATAFERGLVSSIAARKSWDQGYAACVHDYCSGFDVELLIRRGLRARLPDPRNGKR